MKVTIRKRGRLNKNEVAANNYYTWKDLNVGIDIHTNDFKIHTISCSEFTRRFYKEQNIDLCEDETVFKNERRHDTIHYKVSLGGENIIPRNQPLS